MRCSLAEKGKTMANAYVCDACGETITDPHNAKMKEFYIAWNINGIGNYVSCLTKRRTKVHLCDDCYHALCEIAEKKRVKDNG